MTPLLEEIQPCVSVAMGVATLLAKAVETLLRVTENRVMPAKEEREKGKEGRKAIPVLRGLAREKEIWEVSGLSHRNGMH